MNSKLLVLSALTAGLLIGCSNKLDPNGASKGQLTADGQERGNGTDYVSLGDRSAWFLGATETVKYCVQLDSNFGVSEEVVSKSIADSLSDWIQYISERAYLPERFAKTFVRTVDCDSATDLRFVLGGGIPKQSLERGGTRVGSAVRTAYDSQKGWSKGYIWLTNRGSVDASYEVPTGGVFPEWREPSVLKAVVLHELGHIYGVDHIEGTVMDEDLSFSLMSFDDEESKLLLGGIDGYRELVPSKKPEVGTLGPSVKSNPVLAKSQVGTDVENFRLLVGRGAVGEIVAKIEGGNLVITDAVGVANLAIEPFSEKTGAIIPGRALPVFLTQQETNGQPVYTSNVHPSSMSDFKLKLPNGDTIVVTSFQNIDVKFGVTDGRDQIDFASSATTIRYLSPAGPKILFTTGLRELGRSTTAN